MVSGDNSLTGTYNGKDAVGGPWVKLLENGFRTTPTEFIAEGDKVVAICETSLGGQQAGSLNMLSYDGEGKLIRLETYGGEERSTNVPALRGATIGPPVTAFGMRQREEPSHGSDCYAN